MGDQATGPIGAVVDYAKRELAMDGVEVKGWGRTSVTLRLPYELGHLNEIIDQMTEKFGGEITFQNTDEGGVLVVTPDAAHKPPIQSASLPPPRACAPAVLAGVVTAMVIMLVVALLLLPHHALYSSPRSAN